MKISSINNYSYNHYNNTPNFGKSFVHSAYNTLTDKLAVGIGKIIDTDTVQKLSTNLHKTNIATHIFSATGILLSGFFIGSIARSKKIEEERKKPLMINTAISCAIATVGGYTIDKLLDKPLNKFTDNFTKANSCNPNIHKYLDGLKNAKSALIFGMLYRFVVPIISMCLAEKVVEKNKINKTA